MSIAYVDASVVVAILFGEAQAAGLRRILKRYEEVIAADLLTAEVLAATYREGIAVESARAATAGITMLLPSRPLRDEIVTALAAGQLRGGDLWHVACALYAAGDARDQLDFVTRDVPQRAVARRLGFPTP